MQEILPVCLIWEVSISIAYNCAYNNRCGHWADCRPVSTRANGPTVRPPPTIEPSIYHSIHTLTLTLTLAINLTLTQSQVI